MKPIVISKLRAQPEYRSEAFYAGLKRLGYQLVLNAEPRNKRDLLLLWNKQKGTTEAQADAWEAKGGTVIVAENGYIGVDDQKRKLYAISVHSHHGWFPVGSEDRFSKLGIDVKPWQPDNHGRIVVCAQRGIGSKIMASPQRWSEQVVHDLRKATKREVLLRPHPGERPAKTKLEDDLKGAFMCAIWSSGCGVKALVEGVPVTYGAPRWICEEAAVRSHTRHNVLRRDDGARMKALHKMAHGQWTVAEIESGTPFDRILNKLGESLR